MENDRSDWPNEIEKYLKEERDELESLRSQCFAHEKHPGLPNVSRQKLHEYLDYQISILDGMLYNHSVLWMVNFKF